MRRFLALTVALIVAMCGCGTAVADSIRLQPVSCPEQGFTTACEEGLTWVWEDDTGINIWTDEEGYIPYLLIYRNEGGGSNVEGYFNDVFTPQMREDYGDRLIEVGEFQTYTVAGVEMPGMMYTYLVNDVPVVLFRVFDMRWGGNVCYTAKYLRDEPDDTLRALAIAVSCFQLDGRADMDTAPEAAPSPDGQADATAAGLSGYTVAPRQPIIQCTAPYSDGRFTVTLPEGWQIIADGEYAGLAFRAFDPNNPQRSIFFFGKMEPFLKSQAAKEWYWQQATLGGPSYALIGDAPMLEDMSLRTFLTKMPDIRAFCEKYRAAGLTMNPELVPDFAQVQVLESWPSAIACAPTCNENLIARIQYMTTNGTAGEAQVTAQTTWMGDYTTGTGGVDTWPYTVYNFMGVTAPQGELTELEPILTQCLATFSFTPEYLRAAMAAAEASTEAILSISQSMQSAMDSYNAAWESRQTSYDIQSQKYSDATLGYDRLYDSQTNEVYLAESGFWDDYSLHREQFGNPNLQLIDGDSEAYYLRGVDYTITR